MIPRNHPFLSSCEYVFARQPFRIIKGLISAYVAYPIAEKMEKRLIRPKIKELNNYYNQSLEARIHQNKKSLTEILAFAGREVPYYRDLFASLNFNPEKILLDLRYLNELPYLDKAIIREQGSRLLSKPLSEVRHHLCKTGGSTGHSVNIYYDQSAADYAAAVTIFARSQIGKKKYKSELHFACRFPDQANDNWPNREDFKGLAMYRSNIFFDSTDDHGLEVMWKTLQRRRPYLIHEHPSTIYALACYIEKKYKCGKSFEVFESSGELLQPYMREKIKSVLKCRVIDRYGLAEMGVVAYETGGADTGLRVLDSEAYAESRGTDTGESELVLTGFRNRLMPIIRFATGDLAKVKKTESYYILENIVGRIHDIISLNGINYPTHHIMDILDHRVGGIQEFQIDIRGKKPIMKIITEPNANSMEITNKINSFWENAFEINFVGHSDLVKVGDRAKFRHVVSA